MYISKYEIFTSRRELTEERIKQGYLFPDYGSGKRNEETHDEERVEIAKCKSEI